MDTDRKVVGEELRGPERGETVIRIYSIRKEYIFNKRERENLVVVSQIF